MNAVTQSIISYSETLKSQENASKRSNKPRKANDRKATRIETMTIAAINAEISVIEQQLAKRS